MISEKEPDAVSEPRWPAFVAILAVAGLNMALPPSFSFGPRWLLLAIVVGLLIPGLLAHRAGKHYFDFIIGHLVAGIVTLFMVFSVGLLIRALPTHREPPVTLLRSAAALWITNILVFASWYWRLDAGGPHKRDEEPGHNSGALLFPQMSLDAERKGLLNIDADWSPQFIDYLFFAFNTSTALSPADTAVLSRWAKALAMMQASISLTIIVILAARAVNIL